MGTSLADRAWSRESAVFRITGVLAVYLLVRSNVRTKSNAAAQTDDQIRTDAERLQTSLSWSESRFACVNNIIGVHRTRQ